MLSAGSAGRWSEAETASNPADPVHPFSRLTPRAAFLFTPLHLYILRSCAVGSGSQLQFQLPSQPRFSLSMQVASPIPRYAHLARGVNMDDWFEYGSPLVVRSLRRHALLQRCRIHLHSAAGRAPEYESW